jgi:acyl-CoA thioester hydrolase
MKKKIYYYDTDCGGVVYYANYLKYLEEARTEFLEERGILVKDLIEQGTFFVVARQEIDYKLPARYADVLEIETRLTDTSGVRANFEYEIKNQNNQTVAKAKTVLVFVDINLKPKLIPEEVRRKIA